MVTINCRAGAQQLDARLVADLDPAAGEEGHAPVEIGGLGALREVEGGTLGTELVVEVVSVGEFVLAHVAVLRFAERSASLRSPVMSPGVKSSGGNTFGVV